MPRFRFKNRSRRGSFLSPHTSRVLRQGLARHKLFLIAGISAAIVIPLMMNVDFSQAFITYQEPPPVVEVQEAPTIPEHVIEKEVPLSAGLVGDQGQAVSTEEVKPVEVIEAPIILPSNIRITPTYPTIHDSIAIRAVALSPDTRTTLYLNGTQYGNKTSTHLGQVLYSLSGLASANYNLTISDTRHSYFAMMYVDSEQFIPSNSTANDIIKRKPDELNTFTTDFFPPKSNVIINGSYNEKTNWYYGTSPRVTFNATDDFSGVKYIVVKYRTFDSRCKNYECYLQPSESLIFNKSTEVNKGHVKVEYFAVDKSNKTEATQYLDLWIDGVAPEIYIMKIYTETKDNIPIGSNCDDENRINQCVMVQASVNETITFEMLGSDHISGIENIYYRNVKSFDTDPEWILIPRDIPHKLEIQYPHAGFYKLELKAFDVAGNDSVTKVFWIKII